MNTANATKLSQLENVRIMEHINGYFNELNRNHRDFEEEGKKNRTIQTYEGEIRSYFHLMRFKEKGRELEYLSIDDISITQEDYEAYIDKLCGMKDEQNKNKYLNKTINKKATILRSFLKYMKKKKVIDTDISYLELIKGEKERKNHYEAFETDQVLEMANLALQEKEKGEIKRQLILLTLKTGFRLSEVLGLKWNSFIEKNNEVHVVGIGKGNKSFDIKIPREIYDELLKLNQGESEHVFCISDKGIQRMMDRFKTKMGLENRNLVFHSIRKCFGTNIWRLSDIENARRALRHENIATTQIYLGAGNFEVNDIIYSIDKVDTELYKNVDHNSLVEAISSLPKSMQILVNAKLYELKTNK